MTRRVDVRIGQNAVPVGELIFEVSGTRETSVFSYYQSWLSHPRGFGLSPDMPLSEAPFYGTAAGNKSALPLPISDGAPDSWGRQIIRMSFKSDDGRGRSPNDMDYLLESDDLLRSGALRYFDGPGPDAIALAPPRVDEKGNDISVPRVYELDTLVAKARAFEADPESYPINRGKLMGIRDDDLLANIGSLGGARPKVNVRDDSGHLWIAKLAKQGDTYALSRTEIMTLRLAKLVGVQSAQSELLITEAQKYPIALIKRFDRTETGARVGFISGQTFMGLEGTEPGNYVDLAHRMLRHCENPVEQIRELHRRLMFTVLVQNADDHLRNHGFLAVRDGKWRLSPAFDINPVPETGVTLKTSISDIHGNAMSIQAVIEAAPFFEVTEDEAARAAREMAGKIQESWRGIGATLGMSSGDYRAISPALDNVNVKAALALGQAMPVGQSSGPSFGV